VDWEQVTSVAITGAVGIAGVIGTITAAKIGARAATESARLSDKRRVYARAIATMDAAVLAAQADRSGLSDVADKDLAAARDAALLVAANAMGELQLTVPPSIAPLATLAMGDLTSFCDGHLNNTHMAKTRRSLFDELRADLDKEAGRGD
jgi:hypothetical protein